MQSAIKLSGRFRIIKKRGNEIISISEWIKNLVVSGTNTGRNLIAQRLANLNTSTYDIIVTKAKIGTGTTAPADSDTDLETSSATINSVADRNVAGDIVTLEFFISDADLPNDTYTEFGIFCGNQLFARSLISPEYTKSSGEDTLIEYEININV